MQQRSADFEKFVIFINLQLGQRLHVPQVHKNLLLDSAKNIQIRILWYIILHFSRRIHRVLLA